VKRWAWRIAVLLVIGLALSVATAWLPLLRGKHPPTIQYPVDHLPWPDEIALATGARGLTTRMHRNIWWDEYSASAIYRVGDEWRVTETELLRAGFPWHCLSAWRSVDAEAGELSSIVINAEPPQGWHAGIDVEALWRDRRLPYPVFGLPLVPRWAGLIMNTLVYAMLALPLFVWRPIRAVMRARRGQCGYCAYPIGTSPVCTECGGAVTARTGAGA